MKSLLRGLILSVVVLLFSFSSFAHPPKAYFTANGWGVLQLNLDNKVYTTHWCGRDIPEALKPYGDDIYMEAKKFVSARRTGWILIFTGFAMLIGGVATMDYSPPPNDQWNTRNIVGLSLIGGSLVPSMIGSYYREHAMVYLTNAVNMLNAREHKTALLGEQPNLSAYYTFGLQKTFRF